MTGDPAAQDGRALPPGTVAIVHDYLTQRGGAERVVLAMARAFPGARIHTSLYQPEGTFSAFASLPVSPGPLQALPGLSRRHRLAFPALAPAFASLTLDAPVVLCSSSGWAHGVRTRGRKVVYCHTPARWLYAGATYLGDAPRLGPRLALKALGPALRRWDRRSAARAHRYLTNSSAVRDRIRATYGIEAEVIPPPPALEPAGPQEEVAGLEPGYILCVSRLLPYKNVDAVMAAVGDVPGARLVVVGTGPEKARLDASSNGRVRLLGRVEDPVLRWCYANCSALVAASQEDFGLTPLEANLFGKPAVVLEAGGFLDTVTEGLNGTFFARPAPGDIAAALRRALARHWEPGALRAHGAGFSEQRFAGRLVEVVAEEASIASS